MLLNRVTRFLQPFYEVTEKLSAEKRPTISLGSSLELKLMMHLTTDFRGDTINEASESCHRKLDWYTQFTDKPLVAMATVLDSGIKDKFLQPEAQFIAKDIIKNHLMEADALSSSFDSTELQSHGRNTNSSIFD